MPSRVLQAGQCFPQPPSLARQPQGLAPCPRSSHAFLTGGVSRSSTGEPTAAAGRAQREGHESELSAPYRTRPAPAPLALPLDGVRQVRWGGSVLNGRLPLRPAQLLGTTTRETGYRGKPLASSPEQLLPLPPQSASQPWGLSLHQPLVQKARPQHPRRTSPMHAYTLCRS